LSGIRKLSETKTVVMITHRLMNVIDADKIFCLENGAVAGSGTHDELLGSCKTYRDLWNTQKELEEFGMEADA